VQHWNERIAAWTEHLVVHASPGDPWYLGRPLLVTANDPALGLFNGDTGVLVADPSDGVTRAAFARGAGTVLVAPERLAEVQTLHAMTVHRGQGSQFEAVTVVLPSQDSPLLTRELLYTAVTRARRRIRIVGTPEAVAAGVQRRVRRASGLGRPIAG
jgi:exodeoxyribonuclease V alpha subunit